MPMSALRSDFCRLDDGASAWNGWNRNSHGRNIRAPEEFESRLARARVTKRKKICARANSTRTVPGTGSVQCKVFRRFCLGTGAEHYFTLG
jgi:hypothetical protein